MLKGVPARPLPLMDRKARLAELLSAAGRGRVYDEHLTGDGRAILKQACRLKAEGIVSKRVDAPYAPGNRGLRRWARCGRLIYAGRAGTGLDEREIGDLRQRLEPLAVATMPLASAPPRDSRFGRARVEACALGAARAGGRDHLSHAQG
jgi:bifunctional non-homologous end joining protein LigD